MCKSFQVNFPSSQCHKLRNKYDLPIDKSPTFSLFSVFYMCYHIYIVSVFSCRLVDRKEPESNRWRESRAHPSIPSVLPFFFPVHHPLIKVATSGGLTYRPHTHYSFPFLFLLASIPRLSRAGIEPALSGCIVRIDTFMIATLVTQFSWR